MRFASTNQQICFIFTCEFYPFFRALEMGSNELESRGRNKSGHSGGTGEERRKTHTKEEKQERLVTCLVVCTVVGRLHVEQIFYFAPCLLGLLQIPASHAP